MNKMIKKALLISAKLLLVLTIITGVIYPVVITTLGGFLFPKQANGSILTIDNKVVGSSLLLIEKEKGLYFQGRGDASCSKVDPHQTVEEINRQKEAIISSRHLREEEVNALIEKYTVRPFLGIFGNTVVNVTLLNHALDTLK